ncbi:MAG: hypothetical protein KAS32_09295 [Candidatus Peribacteraceae bacterium]|nr:hypothetical protein [Candidatus Peribacteraceae bacterium]
MTEKSKAEVRLYSVRLINAIIRHLELSGKDMTNETISYINEKIGNHKNGV